MSEFQPYPQGQIAIGNGVLQHASTAKLDATNNAKLVHMLAASPAGWTEGTNDLSGSFEGMIPAEGPEMNYLKLVMLKKRQKFRFKMPGTVLVIDGVLTSVNHTIAAGEGVTYSVNFIGKATNVS